MCNFYTSWDEESAKIKDIEKHLSLLQEMQNDGLVLIEGNSLSVPDSARAFVRNICMAFDKKMQNKMPETKLFSMTI
jgi:oxygen-independent coproporphyrinogen-3 oxidase